MTMIEKRPMLEYDHYRPGMGGWDVWGVAFLSIFILVWCTALALMWLAMVGAL